ncbi:MAG: GspH/FimT family protein [Gammaproteobacteria bacterium]|nr:GspH/FimT family protein [Gammaproteobacteria bacterium]
MIQYSETNGFSLIELIAALAIAAILLTIGVPGFQSIVQNNKLATTINHLVSDLHLARMAAIKRNDSVTICKRKIADTDCSRESNWGNGWIVFQDSNRNGSVDAGEDVIRIKSEIDSELTIHFPRRRITYTSQGFAYGFTGTFVISDSRGASYAKKRVLSNTGRIRIG